MLEVVVGHVPGVAAGRGVRGGTALEVVGGLGHHAFLAVEGILGLHSDKGDGLQALIVLRSLVAAHQLSMSRLKCLMADFLTERTC
jgi:hypothetical protein